MNQPAPLRVLIIDDNVASAQTLGWMIELMGHEITLAHDGKSGIDTAREFRPAVILMDIGLPNMNGYEVCAAMRQDPLLKDCVFIAQTGWGQQEHRQRSREAGFSHHLVKPVDMNQLQTLIASIAEQLRDGNTKTA